MEITRDHAEALIHSGPCERAKEALTVHYANIPTEGVCAYCDLVRLVRINSLNLIKQSWDDPKDGLPMTDESGVLFLSIRSWLRNRKKNQDETESPPKGHISTTRSS